MNVRSEAASRADGAGAPLRAAGLPDAAVEAWLAAVPQSSGVFTEDCRTFGVFWRLGDELVAHLPAKPRRAHAHVQAAETIHRQAREARERFLRQHAEAVYAGATHDFSRSVRLQDLVYVVADAIPGLAPTRGQVAAEAAHLQRDKDGLEIDQGILLAHILGDERAGRHLCHAMLLPRDETAEHLARFVRDGVIDLGPARVERRGRAAHLTAQNPRYLNAEDQGTLDMMEIAVDVAILDPATDVAVMRGGVVEHPKYRGRHIFGAGINLTHLYRGKIPFVWFLQRDLGFVNKFMRGVARPDELPDDVHGTTIEKPWIAAVDTFAIGGHCQVLLTMDYVLAADDAFMTLPARKEGIIPGAANLRLPRFTGDRLARQLIQYERRLECNSPEGRLICDEIAPAAAMDAAIERVVEGMISSGAVSAVGNRRAFRIGEEPLDAFRSYFAIYAREQAYCHFSPALIANLERHWNAQNRRA
ncbi:MAG TPA: enoyl-CoA hydratase/isomerase family protein [Xanthobacteraceae bacterium]|nr:enoyl-CoA hydratase/isomerase family protein [Xanthobacteraceae bacterium]